MEALLGCLGHCPRAAGVCVCVYSALYIKEEVHTSGARTELGVERRWKMKVPYFFISRKCLLLSLLIL